MPLVMEGVSVHTPAASDRRVIIHELNHRFDNGSLTLIIGKTGSGKSSLLFSLAGLIKPSEGTVHISENNQQRSVQTGIAFQYPEHQLFASTVRSELAYSLRRLKLTRQHQEKRIQAAVEQVGLPSSVLERSPFTLSGGEKRRVSLASTIVTEPDWLLLDEPTAALDGGNVHWLVSMLQLWKGRLLGGAVVVSHDLDTFLPIADQVIVMKEGRIVASLTPVELFQRPDVLLQAGIGLPSSMRLAAALADKGIAISEAMTPEQAAVAINQQLSADSERCLDPIPALSNVATAAESEDRLQSTRSTKPAFQGEIRPCTQRSNDSADRPCNKQSDHSKVHPSNTRNQQSNHGAVRRLDPRAKWFVYMLLSIGILLQNHWAGIGLSIVLTLAVMWVSRININPLMRMTRPFILFSAIAVLLSGLQLGESLLSSPQFSVPSASITLARFTKILLVMLLGFVFTLSTTQLEMKRALEQSLSGLARLRLPVQNFSLGASLLLRFIPIISNELERLALIVRARRGRKNIKAADIPALTIPLILSVMHRAEELTLAMEVRGFQLENQVRTIERRLKMNSKDKVAIFYGTIVLLLFICLEMII